MLTHLLPFLVIGTMQQLPGCSVRIYWQNGSQWSRKCIKSNIAWLCHLSKYQHVIENLHLNVARLEYGNASRTCLIGSSEFTVRRIGRLIYLRREMGTENVKLTAFYVKHSSLWLHLLRAMQTVILDHCWSSGLYDKIMLQVLIVWYRLCSVL
jgi:hypothetical protein